MRHMSEFKYLRVVDKKPEKKIRVKKAIKSVSREIVEEFNNSGLKYAHTSSRRKDSKGYCKRRR